MTSCAAGSATSSRTSQAWIRHVVSWTSTSQASGGSPPCRSTGRPRRGFRLRALEEMFRIPYGTTISYGELAARAGQPPAPPSGRASVRDEPDPGESSPATASCEATAISTGTRAACTTRSSCCASRAPSPRTVGGQPTIPSVRNASNGLEIPARLPSGWRSGSGSPYSSSPFAPFVDAGRWPTCNRVPEDPSTTAESPSRSGMTSSLAACKRPVTGRLHARSTASRRNGSVEKGEPMRLSTIIALGATILALVALAAPAGLASHQGGGNGSAGRPARAPRSRVYEPAEHVRQSHARPAGGRGRLPAAPARRHGHLLGCDDSKRPSFGAARVHGRSSAGVRLG